MKSRFTEEQIIKILKEHEGGKKPRRSLEKTNSSEQAFYRWKSKYGGMELNEAKRLKQIEEGNRRKKQMVAGLSLDNRILKDINSKNF